MCPAPEIFPCFQQQGRGKGHGDNHVQSQHKTYSLSLVIPRADGRADRPPRALLEMGRSGGRGSGGRLLLTQAGPGLHLLPAFRPHSASLHFAFHVQLVLCSWCKDENVNSFQSFFYDHRVLLSCLPGSGSALESCVSTRLSNVPFQGAIIQYSIYEFPN